MVNEKFVIGDYAEQLQKCCGNFKACKRCMKRGKNIASHLCIIKRTAFTLSVIKYRQEQKQESENKQ